MVARNLRLKRSVCRHRPRGECQTVDAIHSPAATHRIDLISLFLVPVGGDLAVDCGFGPAERGAMLSDRGEPGAVAAVQVVSVHPSSPLCGRMMLRPGDAAL